MNVIFLKEYKNNKKNDIKDVADGFAKNVLIPQGIVMIATKDNLSMLKRQEQKDLEAKKQKEIEDDILIEKVKTLIVVINKDATPKGIIHGSVTTSEIEHEFYLQTGIKIDKKDIKCDKISTFGNFNITLNIGNGKKATFQLIVKS